MNNVNVDDFKEVQYISWNGLSKSLKRHGYYDKASDTDYIRLRQIVNDSECSAYTIYRLAYDIVSHTTFNDEDTFEDNIAYVMCFISDNAVHRFYEYKGKEVF